MCSRDSDPLVDPLRFHTDLAAIARDIPVRPQAGCGLATSCESERFPLHAVVVPLSDDEIALLQERATAHGMGIVDFIRLCSLTLPTVTEGRSFPGFGGAR